MNTQISLSDGIRADRFAAIEFETSNGPKGPGAGKRLGRPWVFKWMFEATWANVCKSIATADWTKKQTTKALFNDLDRWGGMKHGTRHSIGRCLRYFTENRMVPLYVINPKSTGTKYYGLRDQ